MRKKLAWYMTKREKDTLARLNMDLAGEQYIPLFSQMPEWYREEWENNRWYTKTKWYLINRARDIKYAYRRFLKRFERRIL